jgi:hypothetical protein
MSRTRQTTTVDVPKSFTDVLYLTSKDRMPTQIERLLKQKTLSFVLLQIDKFPHILHRLDLIGTVIVDLQSFEASHQHKLARIIEALELGNVGAILLSDRVKLPVRSFSLAGPAVKSFSLASEMELVSVEDLWAQISVNLAYRKKNSPPATAAHQWLGGNDHNGLTEQLAVIEELVDSLSEELHMAGLVQRDFLPAHMPNTDRLSWAAAFLPFEWVSGDIYDVARIDETYVGFYVADAVGHAMPAALLTIFIKQALVMRETVGNSYRVFSPDEVMKTLNARMNAQKLSGHQFATCCYCLLNTKTLELTYARAGHPYPILLRPNQPPQQLEVRGALLGIFEHSEYPQNKIQLQPGDKLLVYSDGAEPFIGSFHELTGFNFCEEFLQIKDLPVGEMMDGLKTIAQTKKVAPSEVDDITALVLQIQ